MRAHQSCRGVLHVRVCRGAARCCSSFVLAGWDEQAWGVSRGLLPAQGCLQMLQHQLSPELTKQTTASRSAQAVQPYVCCRLGSHL